MATRIELGTLQMTISVAGGEMRDGYPCLEVLQDNLKEALPSVPDGTYRWTLTMNLEGAEQVQDVDK